MKLEEKQKAIHLRKKGLSMKTIASQLNVSKASVSLWVRDIILTPEQISKLQKNSHTSHIIEKRRHTRLSNELKKRQVFIDKAKKDFTNVSKADLKIIGIMLYWAEGRKKGKRILSFANSDPDMIRIMMKFFKEICGVPDERFRGHIHTYSHTNIVKSEEYWSRVSGIPVAQFYKTYAKKSSASKDKRNTLPYGTFDIYVCDIKLFLHMMGWIEKITALALHK